jgi:hypothetical protein
MTVLDKIMAYEHGDLDAEATVALFQELIDTGLAYRLQGHYGRTAARLIEAGLVRPKQATSKRKSP